jgi:hypothetical protein
MIEPKSTDNRPRLSPKTPQSIPPTNNPPICQLLIIGPKVSGL